VANKIKSGRPSAYKPEYARIAFRHALLGATDQDLAAAFAVTERTLTRWQKSHPDFLASIRSGKDEADAKVAECLFKRATGYDKPDTHFSTFKGEVIATPCTKHYPPEVAAMVFWLKNRKPQLFRDKPDVNITVNNETNVDMSKPLEEWGPKEIEAELQRRGALPQIRGN
jgi:hypothetical protein